MDQDPAAIKHDIEQTRERMGETVEALAYKTDVAARAKDAVSDRVQGITGAISDVVDSARSALGGAAANAQSAAANAADVVAGVGTSTGDAVAHARMQLPSGTDAKERFETVRALVSKNPLGLAIGSVAAGFLAGLLLPVSDIERDQVGPIGEQMVGNAKAAAGDAMEQGKTAIAQIVNETLNVKSTPLGPVTRSHSADGVDAEDSSYE